jgi:FAD synthetase
MKSVLFFGTFDPIHAGHRSAFAQAKALGDRLIVVVARDVAITEGKKRASHAGEHDRLAQVASDSSVDEAMLGDGDASSYQILRTIPFDILALGYDQQPSDDEVYMLLQKYSLSHVRVVRLAAYEPTQYKSSLLRPS